MRSNYSRNLAARRAARTRSNRQALYLDFVRRHFELIPPKPKIVTPTKTWGYLKARFEFLKKFNFTCQYCGRKAPEVAFHIDHIFPKSKGGTNDINNLTLACDACNLGKGDRIL